MTKPIHLVPYDFSTIFRSALRLAIDLAEYNKGSVFILHIASKKADKTEAEQKMKKVLLDIKESKRHLVESRVLIGDIYKDIALAAEILDAAMIVMSTHGAHGLQKLRGSNALRLVNSSSVPFMITQGSKYVDKMKHILMTICHQKESLQVAQIAATIAKQFNSTIHLVGYRDKNEQARLKAKNHYKILHKFFSKQGINVEYHDIESNDNYEKSLFKYAKETDADLLATTFFNTTIISGINSFVQTLLENEDDIPVLTVNAEELGVNSVSSVMM
jgi:nucleotide-binding universal stress UspA family protein